MNILSLFDGMSCGQLAINRAGIKYDKYFASEIDKYAIKVTMANFPDTIQLGSVVDVDCSKLPQIDLLIGGSPCQSFSFAGKRKGMSTKDEQEILTLDHYLRLKEEQYEFEGQSYLFWEYMRILNEAKPKYFLLENVMMGDKWERVLSKAIGVNPVKINSSLVSAQNRERLYWTNIGMKPMGLFGDLFSIIKQPKDKEILLKDILQDNPNSISYAGQAGFRKEFIESDKATTIMQRDYKGMNNYGINVVVDNGESIIDEKYYLSEKQQQKVLGIPVDEKYYLSEKMINGFLAHNKRHIEEKNQSGFNWKPTEGNKKANCLRANAALCATDNSIIEKKIIVHNIPEIVRVRKNEVDIPNLQKLLKEHKKITIREIAEKLNIAKTNVEHWFRTDSSFSIPDENVWFQLKELLGIQTDEFDASITEFEEKEGVFEKSNRVYDEDGISPTLTSTNADEKILVREVKQINNTNLKSNGGTQPYQQDRIYDSEGISPALSANKSDLLVLSGTLRTHKDGNGFREIKTGKGATIPARAREDGSGQNVVSANNRIRRLTPIECERLQTVPDNYTNHVSDSQRYKMLGNGWTIDVISHIFSYLKQEIDESNNKGNE